MFLRRILRASAAGVVALAGVACSQSSEPEELQESVSDVVEANAAEGAATSTQKKKGKKARCRAPKEADAAPAPAQPEVAEAAPSLRPVVMGPFVPSAPGKRIAHVNVPGPYVAVTFDDGPHATLTPQVLDIFNRHGAHATFFVLGCSANLHRSILARAVAEGHEVGAHSWSHIDMRASSLDKIKDEFDRTNAVIEEATGRAPRVMRPPYGSATCELIDMVYNRYGTPAILWDVDTSDWRKPGVQTVINCAVNKAQPGSIILLHDIHSSTLEAVEAIVTGLQARGFKLVTVSELIAIGRRAAGATAPERAEAEAALPAETSAPAEPAALPATQQQQPLPEGAATIGVPPAPEVQPAPATPTPVE